MCSKDVDRLMSCYSPDVVYFDVVPPLRYRGAAELRRDYARWFDAWKSAIGAEFRDLNIAASGEIAVAHMLHRTSGILKDGREVGYWVRATICCQHSERRWLIGHEHVSLPIEMRSGRAAMDLLP
jgi:ketosteroid isomerase-like protein